MRPDQDKIDASIRADHPFAPYVTYEPTPYDVDLTDDPDVGWPEYRARSEVLSVNRTEADPEAEKELGIG